MRMLSTANVFDKSNKTQLNFVLSFIFSIIFSMIVAIALFIDLFFLNLNWDLLNILCLSMKVVSWLAITVSSTFEREYRSYWTIIVCIFFSPFFADWFNSNTEGKMPSLNGSGVWPSHQLKVTISAHTMPLSLSLSLLGTWSYAEAIRRQPLAISRLDCLWDSEPLNRNIWQWAKKKCEAVPALNWALHHGGRG
jgi:hypothetical protein